MMPVRMLADGYPETLLPAVPRRALPSPQRRRIDGMTSVVVVDDDPDIRELVAMKLSNAGYRVSVEADGESGLATALSVEPDLVVLDWMMPGLTGIEVCRALRDDPRTAATAVMLLTARAQEEDIETGFAAGADDYLVKPFSVRELATRVEAILSRRR
jgi:two-component system, OmpR family, phosphate regulon response regulator PhoB